VTDILIAGAGPVGLTLALALHRRGIGVQVLEKRERLSTASRASTFHPPTLEALDDLGLFAALRAGGIQVDRLLWRRVESGASAVLDLGILAGETRFPFRWHREQHVLTPALLAALPAGTVRFDAAVTALDQDDAGVTLRCDDGSTHRARYAIGCDGASGTMRGLAGIAADIEDYPHRVLRVQTPLDLRDHIPDLDGIGYLHAGAASLSLLRMPGLWRLIFRVAPDMTDADALAESHVRARIARFLPELAEMPIASRDIYGARKAMAHACRAGRVLLAGDAAHQTNTRGGMNMNAGMHDAMTLAAALGAVLDGAGDAPLSRWAAARLTMLRETLLPRTDARVAGTADEVARMASLAPEQALAWARESAMLDIAQTGSP
jgi:2-polyprenyl-6-methoxyphenol hydroxylase-like FAD-dependent oxidoreductase